MTKQIDSEATRIPDRSKLRKLYDLLDYVFKTRSDAFHLDLTDCVELNSDNFRRERTQDSDEEGFGSASAAPIGDEEPCVDDIVNQDYEYRDNSCVAVKPHDTDVPFWIGKVISSSITGEEVFKGLKLHWPELLGSTNVYEGRYTLSFLQASGRTKGKAWQSIVAPQTVLINFDRLARRGQLPAALKSFSTLMCTSNNN